MSGAAQLRVDPFPPIEVLDRLWRDAWGAPVDPDYGAVLKRSLAHLGAYDDDRLVGFVNVAWDGGAHTFLLDTCVARSHRRRGVGRHLVERATEVARERGARWLHVDFEPDFRPFYRACGFRPTSAGLIRLGPSG